MICDVEPQPMVMVKVGYSLPADLVRRLKLVAVREDRRQYEILRAALEDYLSRRESGTAWGGVIPPNG